MPRTAQPPHRDQPRRPGWPVRHLARPVRQRPRHRALPARRRRPGRRGRLATWTPGADGAPDPEIECPPSSTAAASQSARLSRSRGTAPSGATTGRRAADPDHPAASSRPRPARSPGQRRRRRLRPGDRVRSRPRPAVPEGPELLTPEEWQARAALAAAEAALAPGGVSSAPPSRRPARALLRAPAEDDLDEAEPRRWQSLDEHSDRSRPGRRAAGRPRPEHPAQAARSAIIAGYLHDLGKAHEIWQNAICALADDEEKAGIEAGRPGPSRAATARCSSPTASPSATSSPHSCSSTARWPRW